MAQGDVNVTFAGNLVADPELRFTPSGSAVVNFRVASTPRKFDKHTNQWGNGDPVFMQCTAWNQLGANIAESFSKGMRVIVTGKLRQNNYETKEGEKRSVIVLDVDDAAPSLKYATASVVRNPREDQSVQQGGFGQQQAPNQGGFSQQQAPNQGGQAPNQGGFGDPQNNPWSGAPAANTNEEPPF